MSFPTFFTRIGVSAALPALALLRIVRAGAHGGAGVPPRLDARAALLALGLLAFAPAPSEGQVLYRVNAGGPSLPAADASAPDWAEDSWEQPSPHVNSGSATATTDSAITVLPTVPASVPMALFQSERWDPDDPPEMAWRFPVAPGVYEVRLLFAEFYEFAQFPGGRVFDVLLEGAVVLDDYDIYAEVGGYTGTMKSFAVTVSDDTLEVEFLHVVENPALKGIEILVYDPNGRLLPSPGSVGFGTVTVGATSSPVAVRLRNLGEPGDATVAVTGASVTGPFAHDLAPVSIPPGDSVTFHVTFSPVAAGPASGTLTITHDGSNSPVLVSLSGTGQAAGPPALGFGSSALAGLSLGAPTSREFGPDGRLYVSQQDGLILAVTVARNGPNSYQATAVETIDLIQQIPNHDDDGTPNASVDVRQVTGLVVTGTPANPVLYVGSSDPRIGAGAEGTDLALDTNSGVVSRLTWNGSSWTRLDLVRGLPRSEENHSVNGMALDTLTNTLYVTVGGNTNMGAPSHNFAQLPEYALAAAILSIDLDAIGETTYDLPTLDDETRPGLVDAGDPFGGNDGLNQAKLVPGGPVQVHAPGMRNPYDVVITSRGVMFTVDNGPNAGWGDVPVDCTNAAHEPGVTYGDRLHWVTRAGYYGGHPNPTRGSTANTFNPGNPQSPVAVANPIECDYLPPGQDSSIAVFPASTNGLVEYRASNFGGVLRGDLLAAALDGDVLRVKPDTAAVGLLDLDPPNAQYQQVLFTGFGGAGLDITALDDSGPFPGTVWVAVYDASKIQVFEPNDYGGGGASCSGADSDSLDEDGDGYTNADEIDNGTLPCSAASRPPDHDGDLVSNRNDPDDDNDGIPDTSDAFAIDPANGAATSMPVVRGWNNNEPGAGGLLGLGFTGLMTNGVTDYEALYDPDHMTAGGAAGVVTVDGVPEGDARDDTQEYAFQFGVQAAGVAQPFRARTRIAAPFAGLAPEDSQAIGLFIGTGDQDHYVRVALHALAGDLGLATGSEIGGAYVESYLGPAPGGLALLGAAAVDLILLVDPGVASVQPMVAVPPGPRFAVGPPIAIPAAWLQGPLAVGIIATSRGPAPPFPATWDLIEARIEGAASAAQVEVTPLENINGSTFLSNSISILNQSTGGTRVTRVRFDLSTAMLRDLVFDPTGSAGDAGGKCLTPDLGAAEVGYVSTPDSCATPFSRPRDGGFDVLELQFTDFQPGEVFEFSVDTDPSSIRGAEPPGPGESGSVSGLEMTGGTVVVTFSDGSVDSARLFALPGSRGGSRARTAGPPPAAPGLQVVGIAASPAVVGQASQTVRVSGAPGDSVRLLHVEAATFLDGVPGGGYDVEPFEGNSVIEVIHRQGVVGAGGTVDFAVDLLRTDPEGGLNVFVATRVTRDSASRTGTTSAPWVLSYTGTTDAGAMLPRAVELSAARPNPFERRTTLGFALPRAARARLTLHDVGGARVRTLVDGMRPAGRHVAAWDGRTDRGRVAPPGVYFARLEVDGETRVHRLVRLR